MTFNFREICRLCLGKKESLAPLFREQVPDTVTSLPAKIMSFVPVLKVCCFPLKGLGSLSNACCVVRGDVFCNICIEINSSQLENVKVDIYIFYSVFHGMCYNVSLCVF